MNFPDSVANPFFSFTYKVIYNVSLLGKIVIGNWSFSISKRPHFMQFVNTGQIQIKVLITELFLLSLISGFQGIWDFEILSMKTRKEKKIQKVHGTENLDLNLTFGKVWTHEGLLYLFCLSLFLA